MMKQLSICLLTMAVAACTTPYTHLRGAPGTDYFRPEFDCRRGLLPKEKEPVYLALRDKYRSNFKPAEPPYLLIAGESTAALFADHIYNRELAGYPTVNRAIGGETTLLLLSAMDQDIIALRPKVIFLSIGGNDILGGRCLSEIKQNVRLFLFKVRMQLPDTHVVLAGIPPVLSWKVNSVTPYFNSMLSELAREAGPNVEYFDLWQILADPDRPVLQQRFAITLPVQQTLLQRLMGDTNQPVIEYDRIHFNEMGYVEIARNLKPVLERIRSTDPEGQ